MRAGQVDGADRLPAVHRLHPDHGPQSPARRPCATAWSAGSPVRGVLRPDIVLMENARELVMGRFPGTWPGLLAEPGRPRLPRPARARTSSTEFGLPQRRERALVVAARRPLPLRDLPGPWAGWQVSPKATHVRRAIWELPPVPAGRRRPAGPAARRAGAERGGQPPAAGRHPARRRQLGRPGRASGEAGPLLTPAMRAPGRPPATSAATPTSTAGCGGTGRR